MMIKAYLGADPPYIIAKPTNFDTLPGAFASLAGLPTLDISTLPSNLSNSLLILRNCPSGVPFICCSGRCIHDGCKPSLGCLSVSPNETMETRDFCIPGNAQEACPSNNVGEVFSDSCYNWSLGSCVACHDDDVNAACSAKYASNCPDGKCSNGYRAAYWNNFGCCRGSLETLLRDQCVKMSKIDSRCWGKQQP